jgi:hypothetical protein
MAVLAMVAAGCGQKKDEAAKAPAPAAEKPAAAAAQTQPAVGGKPDVKVTQALRGGMPIIECDKLVPKETRDKFFAGMTPQDGKVKGVGGQESVTCSFQKGQDISLVSALCTTEWAEPEFVSNMNNAKKSLTNLKTVEGIGKHGFSGESTGMTVVVFRDDNTPCYASVATKMGNALDIAKEIAANLQ